jgi:hypothetical protein
MIGEVTVAPRLRPIPDETLPFHAEIDRVWILKGDAVVWEPQRLRTFHRVRMLPSKMVYGGPGVEPGSKVDVVVRFVVKGKAYYLRAANFTVGSNSCS